MNCFKKKNMLKDLRVISMSRYIIKRQRFVYIAVKGDNSQIS